MKYIQGLITDKLTWDNSCWSQWKGKLEAESKQYFKKRSESQTAFSYWSSKGKNTCRNSMQLAEKQIRTSQFFLLSVFIEIGLRW